MTILIIRGGAIGDFIVTLPVFAELRQRWPEARIECLGYPRVSALALAAGLIDDALSLDSADAARLFATDAAFSADWIDRVKRCDVILSYLHDPDKVVRKNLMKCGAKQIIEHSPLVATGHAVDHFTVPLASLKLAPFSSTSDLRSRERQLVGLAGTSALSPPSHRLAPAATVFPAVNDPCTPGGRVHPDLVLSPSLSLPQPLLEQGAAELRRLAGEHVIFLHPGSGSPTKNWPLEKVVELAQRLGRETSLHPAILLGEAEEGVAETLYHSALRCPIIRETDLVVLASLLAAGKGYVGNDAGITHLAAAMGIPVVALFGPTDPAQWAPRGPNVRIVAASHQGMAGLAQVTVDSVLAALTRSPSDDDFRY